MATCTYVYNVGIQTEIGMFSIPYFKVDKNMPINANDVTDVIGRYDRLPIFNNVECSGLLYREKNENERVIYDILEQNEIIDFIPGVCKIQYYGENQLVFRNPSNTDNYLFVTVDTLATQGFDHEAAFMFLFESADNYFTLATATTKDDEIGVAIPEHLKYGYFVRSGNVASYLFQGMYYRSSSPPYDSDALITRLTNYFRDNPPQPAPVQSTDPYADGGDTDASEANGDFDDTSDPIDFPLLPSIGATDTGLITLYNPSLSEVKALATYMWTNPAFDISAWKKIFADPIDAILGLSIVPVAVPDGGVRPIAVGNLLTDVNMNVASQQYIELQCGTLNVNEFWSSYLDYDPYTKAEIYLPYCGVHQLSVDDVMNKTIEVRYHIDILSGSCCAYVKCGDSVLYQFVGQCSSSIPIASGDFSEIVNSALNAALAIGSAIATSGAGVPLATALHTAGAAGAAASAAVNIQKEKIQKSGSLSGTGGMLAIQKPYLILTRPRQAHPANQNHYTGYPSFITEDLSGLSGYTEIEEIHLENVPATDSELNEIVTLLESGVIF